MFDREGEERNWVRKSSEGPFDMRELDDVERGDGSTADSREDVRNVKWFGFPRRALESDGSYFCSFC